MWLSFRGECSFVSMFAQTRVTDGLVLVITAEVVVKVAVNCCWDCFFFVLHKFFQRDPLLVRGL